MTSGRSFADLSDHRNQPPNPAEKLRRPAKEITLAAKEWAANRSATFA
jgi:hypothetical protein